MKDSHIPRRGATDTTRVDQLSAELIATPDSRTLSHQVQSGALPRP